MSIGVIFPVPEPEHCELVREDRLAIFRGRPTQFTQSSTGITLHYQMSDRRIYADGWYDHHVGLAGGSVHIGQMI
jgi:hypothetical protein